MNWIDNFIIKIFKWRFYYKYKTPNEYYVKVLRQLNDDYTQMYLKYKRNDK